MLHGHVCASHAPSHATPLQALYALHFPTTCQQVMLSPSARTSEQPHTQEVASNILTQHHGKADAQTRQSGADGSSDPAQPVSKNSSAPPLVVPKVALLFLAPTGPANEGLWRAFFEAAAHVSNPKRMVPALAAMPASLQHALKHRLQINLTRLVGGPLHPPLTVNDVQSTPRLQSGSHGTTIGSSTQSSTNGNTTAQRQARIQARPKPPPRCSCQGAWSCWVGAVGPVGAAVGWRCRMVTLAACSARLLRGCRCCGSVWGQQGPGAWEGDQLEQEVERLLTVAPASTGSASLLESQHLFSVYVHTLVGARCAVCMSLVATFCLWQTEEVFPSAWSVAQLCVWGG